MKNIHWQNNYFDLIGEPKNLKIHQKVSGSAVIPRIDGFYYLIGIKRKDEDVHWEIPRGFQKEGESFEETANFEETAKRELKEETNIEAKSLKSLGVVMPDSGIMDSKIHLFLADCEKPEHIVLQEDEGIKCYQYYSLNAIYELIRKGLIIDGYTLAAFAKVVADHPSFTVKKLSSNVNIVDSMDNLDNL